MSTRGTLTLIALVTAAALGLGMKAMASAGQIEMAPDMRVYQYGGTPQGTGYTRLKRIVVPRRKCLRITHTNALAERHSGGLPDAGEFTVMVGDVAQSSLESNNGIAYQGQGIRNVVFLPGQSLEIGYWLRPGKNPVLYYYAVSAYGELYDCRVAP